MLDRDPALAAFDDDHEADDHDYEAGQEEHLEQTEFVGLDQLIELHQATRDRDDDAGKDDHRDTVANATLGDLLTEPHDEGGPGRECDHAHQPKAPTGLQHRTLTELSIFQSHRDQEALEKGQANG